MSGFLRALEFKGLFQSLEKMFYDSCEKRMSMKQEGEKRNRSGGVVVGTS